MRFLVLGLLLACPVAAIPYEQVPNPRPRGSHISDLAQVLNPGQEQQLDQQLTALEKANGTQIAVVVVQDCSARAPREYAHRLLNYWGVGQRGVNNGALFLVALQEHRVEVATGDGVRAFVSDGDLKTMLEKQVIPHFKAAHPDQGTVTGLNWMCQHLQPVHYTHTAPLSKWGKRVADPRPSGSLVADPDKLFPQAVRDEIQKQLVPLIAHRDIQMVTVLVQKVPPAQLPSLAKELAQAWQTVGQDGILVIGQKPGGVHLFLSPQVLSQYPPEAQADFQSKAMQAANAGKPGEVARLLTQLLEHPTLPPAPPAPLAAVPSGPQEETSSGLPWWGMAGVGVPGLGLAGYLYGRHRKRFCPQCKGPMIKLDEASDDEYLSQGEREEERIGSVDYDIWLCPACEVTSKGRYSAWFSSYSGCPQCGFRTLSSSSETISAATEYSEGWGRKTDNCRHCSYHNTSEYSIPRIQRQESSSSSDSSWSSSSSSDSSSSWGGGSSSDGGAGASW